MIYSDDNIHEAFEKIAEAKERAGFLDTQRAAMAVMGRKKSGAGQFIVSNEDIKRRLGAQLKGDAVGIPVGVALGLLAARKKPAEAKKFFAALGGFGGMIAGGNINQQRSDLKRLRDAGVDAKWHGFTSRMTPSTRRRLGIDKK